MHAFFTKNTLLTAGWLLAVLFLVSQPLAAQRKTQGVVVDASTSLPVAGARIAMQGTAFKTSSGEDGSFELFFPNTGDMRYTVSAEGYRTVKVRAKEGENRTVVLTKKDSPPKIVEADTLPQFRPLTLDNGNAVVFDADSLRMTGIQHPAQLLQGRVPGLIVQRHGGNPNEDFLFRLRGLSTFTAQTSPLVVVDGLPETSLYLLDPNDLADMRVRRDAASAAAWGIRGASGVIEVETQKITPGSPRISYHGFAGQDFVATQMPVALPNEFTAAGGFNFGEKTDWLKEITRSPLFHAHHLSLTGGSDRIGYAASLGYRNTQGTLRHSGFEQRNGRLRLQAEPWKDRLALHAQLYGTDRKSEFSFQEAFRYAVSFNPTAPTRSNDPDFEQFGGWFEPLTFGSLNPLAIVEQNTNLGAWQQYGGRAGFDFSIFKNLKFSGYFAQQEHERLSGRHVSPQSLFEGGFTNRGRLLQFMGERSNRFVQAALSGTLNMEAAGLKIEHRHGFEQQRHAYKSTIWSLDSVGQVLLTYNGLRENLSGRPASQRIKGARNVHAWFTDWQVSRQYLFLGARLRYEGSNFQENYSHYGLFYGLTAGVKVAEALGLNNADMVARLSYGKTGGLFAALDPSMVRGWFSRTTQPVLANGEFVPGLTFFGNTDFRWEEKREWNFGADFALRRFGLRGSLDFYTNRADGLMIVEPFFVGNTLLGYTPYNTGALTNTGLELALAADLVDKGGFRWQAQLNFFTNKTTVEKFSRTEDERQVWIFAGFDQPGADPPRNLLKEGERLGQMLGAEFLRVDANGFVVLKDLDGSGAGDPFTDVKVIGQAMPRAGFGWQNTLTWGRLDMVFNLRGMTGHRLANSYRIARENIGNPTLNFIQTKYFIPGQLFSGGFSDRYLENASFLMLDYLSAGYRLPFGKGSCRLYVAGLNLLTITGYTGNDPQPRLENFADPLELGVENGNTHFRNQMVVGGVQLSF